jgi:hypothetical protein
MSQGVPERVRAEILQPCGLKRSAEYRSDGRYGPPGNRFDTLGHKRRVIVVPDCRAWEKRIVMAEQLLLAQETHPIADDFLEILTDRKKVGVDALAEFRRHFSRVLFHEATLNVHMLEAKRSNRAVAHTGIRGRSRTLRVNYRTSHQIRMQANRLLGPVVTDVDGNTEDRSDTVSVFNGPPLTIYSLKSESEEIEAVGNWIAEQAKDGVVPHEFGVFVRSEAQLDRAQAAVEKAGMAFKVLDEHVETTSGHVSISTMHLAKGLEFRAVVVMACDDEVIPLQERIETVGDDADLQEVYDTERHLLYVACTRARDYLLVTGVDPASEFLDDFATTA